MVNYTTPKVTPYFNNTINPNHAATRATNTQLTIIQKETVAPMVQQL
ncbi:MAG: hypothetical protein IJW56_07335 [Bacteroides sp.]|nr:hypothetical protein [Bacteroides sp.]